MSIDVDIEKDLGSFCLRAKFRAGDESIALLGASGCGKSLTLKCIAGIEKPDRGRIVVNGVTLFDAERNINLTPQKRRTGLMFQNYGLFPNMTVMQNIRAGGRREKSQKKQQEHIQVVMDSFGLTEYANRYPHQLSGGQQQRTALARILVSGPEILLLDEPFSALDSHLRFRLEREVKQVIREFGKTVVLVSHDRDEVFRMAQRVAIMEQGCVQTVGSSRQVFANPVTRGGAVLTGCQFISAAEMVAPGRVRALDWGIELDVPEGRETVRSVGIRTHKVKPGSGENHFLCRVTEEIENPFVYTLMLRPVEAGEGIPFGWSVAREVWEANRSNTVEINIPKEAILLLRD